MDAFGIGSSLNQAPVTQDLKKFGDNSTGLFFFFLGFVLFLLF
jgi:DNA topoisomerase 2-associated protein PAT1